jgi:hypothetical protein
MREDDAKCVEIARLAHERGALYTGKAVAFVVLKEK